MYALGAPNTWICILDLLNTIVNNYYEPNKLYLWDYQ